MKREETKRSGRKLLEHQVETSMRCCQVTRDRLSDRLTERQSNPGQPMENYGDPFTELMDQTRHVVRQRMETERNLVENSPTLRDRFEHVRQRPAPSSRGHGPRLRRSRGARGAPASSTGDYDARLRTSRPPEAGTGRSYQFFSAGETGRPPSTSPVNSSTNVPPNRSVTDPRFLQRVNPQNLGSVILSSTEPEMHLQDEVNDIPNNFQAVRTSHPEPVAQPSASLSNRRPSLQNLNSTSAEIDTSRRPLTGMDIVYDRNDGTGVHVMLGFPRASSELPAD